VKPKLHLAQPAQFWHVPMQAIQRIATVRIYAIDRGPLDPGEVVAPWTPASVRALAEPTVLLCAKPSRTLNALTVRRFRFIRADNLRIDLQINSGFDGFLTS
jgi:hypothetical protein